MGYTKIVKYGDVIELYSYEKEIKRNKGIDALKAQRLSQGKRNSSSASISNVKKNRLKERRKQALLKGHYERSKRSINRSRLAFFRLCHHNNVHSQSIHFLTLTFAYDIEIGEAYRHTQEFLKRVAKNHAQLPIRYISVPEFTKKGRVHFHVLVYDLPSDEAKKERVTRNYQRQFRQGFLDLRHANYNSKGIAGYMAKYMGKALGDAKLGTRRGFTSSRNIIKISTASGNSLAEHLDMIIPSDAVDDSEERSYDVPYMGRCRLKKLKFKV